MRKRIYLSAPGLVCCAGHNRNELYESCLNGYQGGLVMHELPDHSGKTPVGFVGEELPAAVLPDSACPQDTLHPKDTLAYTGGTKIIRIINAALEQLRPAIEKALSKYGPEKIGVCFGSADNGSEASLLAHRAFFKNNVFPDDYSLRFQARFPWNLFPASSVFPVRLLPLLLRALPGQAPLCGGRN